jgi:hypothetical protein
MGKMVKDNMPKSSAEYIMRKAAQNTLFGLSYTLNQSPLAAEIERRGEAAYKPSKLEKGTGKVIGASIDAISLGSTGSWASFAKFVGADLAFSALTSSKDKTGNTASVEDCISKGVFGSERNVFDRFRKEANEIRANDNPYIIATNERLTKKIPVQSFDFRDWMSHNAQAKMPFDFIAGQKIKDERYKDIPMVIALNMMDEMTGNSGSVDVNGMEAMLGVPVVPISAAKNEGVDELVRHALHIAKYQERPGRQDFCDESDFGGAVHRCIHAVSHLIEDHAKEAQIPIRFAASKIIEGDHLILEKLHLDENEKEAIEHLIVQMEKERGLDRSAVIADMRFTFIEKVCEKTVVKPKESRERIRSEKIDRILTGKYTAIPCFIGIMLIVFYLTFHVIGAGLQNLLQMGIDALTAAVDQLLSAAGVNEVLHDLIIDGIFTGVGSILSFLPIVVTLFFFLSMLEDSGYMARVIFLMDRLGEHGLERIGIVTKQ